jgi:hypothetical protein
VWQEPEARCGTVKDIYSYILQTLNGLSPVSSEHVKVTSSQSTMENKTQAQFVDINNEIHVLDWPNCHSHDNFIHSQKIRELIPLTGEDNGK